MSVTVLVELQAKPEAVNDLKTLFKEILPETRKDDGCQGLDMYSNQEDTTKPGILARIGGMLASPPSIRYFEHVEA